MVVALPVRQQVFVVPYQHYALPEVDKVARASRRGCKETCDARAHAPVEHCGHSDLDGTNEYTS